MRWRLSEGAKYILETTPAESSELIYIAGLNRQWIRSALINLMRDFS